MHIHRIIYPVGQRAFYGEHLTLESGDEVHVIYDCGAKSPWKYALDRETNDYGIDFDDDYDRSNIIDAIFISNFDEDHVNGIYDLVKTRGIKVRKVILPVLEKDRWLRITECEIEYYQSYQNVLSAFRRRGTQLIFVNPLVEEQERSQETYTLEQLGGSSLGNIDENDDNDFNDDDLENIIDSSYHINSGDHVSIANEGVEWIYVPIYFDSLLKLKEDVKDAIEQIPCGDSTLKVEDLENNIGNLTSDILKQVNEAYISVIHNNKPSMPCYSGPASPLVAMERWCHCSIWHYHHHLPLHR